MISGPQLASVVVSCGQWASVVVIYPQLSCCQWASVVVSCCQLLSVVLSWVLTFLKQFQGLSYHGSFLKLCLQLRILQPLKLSNYLTLSPLLIRVLNPQPVSLSFPSDTPEAT